MFAASHTGVGAEKDEIILLAAIVPAPSGRIRSDDPGRIELFFGGARGVIPRFKPPLEAVRR
ncbi:hypothetical protein [Lysobacter gummosus]|uniref:hypothetical protein n=1 Tax=Lysobacter gummosus TaxID=262324 RepID=UPI0036382E7D